ncbi:MAG: hypothetical protein RLZZ347_209 [Candidatus Parcubacteria bacterium]|jgi:hypothetical protein
MKVFGFEFGGEPSAPELPPQEMGEANDTIEPPVLPIAPEQLESVKKTYVGLGKKWLESTRAFSEAAKNRTLSTASKAQGWLTEAEFTALSAERTRMRASLEASGVDTEALDVEAGFEPDQNTFPELPKE